MNDKSEAPSAPLTNEQITAGAAVVGDDGKPIGRNTAIMVWDAMREAGATRSSPRELRSAGGELIGIARRSCEPARSSVAPIAPVAAIDTPELRALLPLFGSDYLHNRLPALVKHIASLIDQAASSSADAPAEQQITRLDVLSLIREHTHRCYVAGVDLLEIDPKYMQAIEDALQSFTAGKAHAPAAAKLECPTCGLDRFLMPCGNPSNCGMTGTAHIAGEAQTAEPAAAPDESRIKEILLANRTYNTFDQDEWPLRFAQALLWEVGIDADTSHQGKAEKGGE